MVLKNENIYYPRKILTSASVQFGKKITPVFKKIFDKKTREKYGNRLGTRSSKCIQLLKNAKF